MKTGKVRRSLACLLLCSMIGGCSVRQAALDGFFNGISTAVATVVADLLTDSIQSDGA